MQRTRLRTGSGRANVLLEHEDLSVRSIVDECVAWNDRDSGRFDVVDGVDVVLKGGPLARSGARRHFLRRVFLRAPAPCEAEFRNLRWLKQRLFRVPEPVAAVTVSRLGRPTRQLLATRPVPGAVPIEDTWRTGTEDERRAWSAELGREVGRMHALRFLHGDLYPRNVLVAPDSDEAGPGHGRALVWIDAWAGGPTAWRRGSLRRVEQDLGAWFSIAADWMTNDEQSTLLLAYTAAREQNGRPVESLDGLVARVQRARRLELTRLERDRRRLRGRPFPIAGWDPRVERPGAAQIQ